MKFTLIKTKLSIIEKICLTGMFTALAMVCQKLFAVNYIPVIPFVRLSFGGPAIIIFSSILLGPIYGAIVGFGSDVLGYLLLDQSGMGFMPQISMIYGLLGFASYFIFSFVCMAKKRKVILGIEIASFAAIWVAITLYVLLNKQIALYGSIYDVPLLAKILVPSITGVLLAGLVVFSILYKGKDAKPIISPLHICFASFICDLLILVIFGSIMKGWAFGFQTYAAILLCQAMILFFNVVLDTALISVFLRFTKKYFVEENA